MAEHQQLQETLTQASDEAIILSRRAGLTLLSEFGILEHTLGKLQAQFNVRNSDLPRRKIFDPDSDSSSSDAPQFLTTQTPSNTHGSLEDFLTHDDEPRVALKENHKPNDESKDELRNSMLYYKERAIRLEKEVMAARNDAAAHGRVAGYELPDDTMATKAHIIFETSEAEGTRKEETRQLQVQNTLLQDLIDALIRDAEKQGADGLDGTKGQQFELTFRPKKENKVFIQGT